MKKVNILKWIVLLIAIATDVFILINAFMDGEASAQESGKIAHEMADVINYVRPETITAQNFDRFHIDIRKIFGHFCLFGFSGVFSTWGYYLFFNERRICFWPWFSSIVLVAGFILAGVSEIAQFSAEGRAPAITDTFIDFSGYLLGFLIVFLIILLHKKHINKAKK